MKKSYINSSDIGWGLVIFVVFIPLTFGSMFFAANNLTPALLGTPNSVERHGIDAVLEGVIAFGGMFIGMFASLLVWRFLGRRFISIETHERWFSQLRELPYPQRKLAEFIAKFCGPTRRAL